MSVFRPQSAVFSDAALQSRQRRHVSWALLVLVVVIAMGTFGFLLLEDSWTAWDALFFTIITITTVGYGSFGIDLGGQVLSVFLMLAGIATCTYAFSQIVQLAVSRRYSWRQHMLRHIAQLSDHFIVCGFGRVGRAVCERFEESGTPVVVMDPDEQRCEWARQHGHLVVQGNAGDDEAILSAGVERCSGLVACTASDNENLVVTLTARSHNAGCNIIARADDPGAAAKFKRAGATRVVAPALFGGHQIATMLVKPNLADFLTQMAAGNDDYQFTEVVVDPGSPLAGTTPAAYGEIARDLVFVAVKREGEPTRIRPAADEPFRAGDIVILAGTLGSLADVRGSAKAA